MKELSDVLSNPQEHARLVQDVVLLVDRRVKQVGGLSGVALKGGYALVSKLYNGKMIPLAVHRLLPEFIRAVEPQIAPLSESERKSLARAWSGKERVIAGALLSITDAKAQRANAVLQKPYQKLRSYGEDQVVLAVPEIAEILSRYL